MLKILYIILSTIILISDTGSYTEEFDYSLPSGTFYSTSSPVGQYYNHSTYMVWHNESGSAIIGKYHNNVLQTKDLGIGETPDAHGAPSIMINSTGHIYVFFGGWNSNTTVKISKNPEDINDWSTSKIYGRTTYVHPFNYNDSTIFSYLRLRINNESNNDSIWFTDTEAYSVSNDFGVTWSNPTIFINFSNSNLSQPRIYANGIKDIKTGRYSLTWDYLDQITSTRHGVWYAYTDNGIDWYNSNNTKYDLPINISNAELIYDRNYSQIGAGILPTDIQANNGNIWIVIRDFNDYLIDRFIDNKWNITKVIYGNQSKIETSSSINVMYAPTLYAYFVINSSVPKDGGDIAKYVSYDNGETWNLYRNITDFNGITNNFPKRILDAPFDDGTNSSISMIWSEGNYAPTKIYGYIEKLESSYIQNIYNTGCENIFINFIVRYGNHHKINK